MCVLVFFLSIALVYHIINNVQCLYLAYIILIHKPYNGVKGKLSSSTKL